MILDSTEVTRNTSLLKVDQEIQLKSNCKQRKVKNKKNGFNNVVNRNMITKTETIGYKTIQMD